MRNVLMKIEGRITMDNINVNYLQSLFNDNNNILYLQ